MGPSTSKSSLSDSDDNIFYEEQLFHGKQWSFKKKPPGRIQRAAVKFTGCFELKGFMGWGSTSRYLENVYFSNTSLSFAYLIYKSWLFWILHPL